MSADIVHERAQVVRRERVTDAGPGTVWYLLLGDGYLLDCGSGQEGKDRADSLSFIIEQRLEMLHIGEKRND